MLAVTRTAYGPNLLSRLLAARTLEQVHAYAKSAWILNGEGLIDDNEMEYLAPIIEHQRQTIRAIPSMGLVGRRAPSATSIRTQHRRPSIPAGKKAAAWLRRRALAKDCIIPTCIAKAFTTGKLAVLAVIARSVIACGQSNMSLPEIAGRAGVGCTTARYAIRDAVQMGLITVTENRCNGTWNRPNTIRVACRRWLRWISGRRAARATEQFQIQAFPLCSSTSLRNLIPTIEIHRFTVRGTSHSKMVATVDPPYRRGTLSSRRSMPDETYVPALR